MYRPTLALCVLTGIDLQNLDTRPVIMTSEIVNLKVTANIPIDCDFWSEGDGWRGLCKSPSVTVRGSGFEDANKKHGN